MDTPKQQDIIRLSQKLHSTFLDAAEYHKEEYSSPQMVHLLLNALHNMYLSAFIHLTPMLKDSGDLPQVIEEELAVLQKKCSLYARNYLLSQGEKTSKKVIRKSKRNCK